MKHNVPPVRRKDPAVDPKSNFIQTPENAPGREAPVQKLLGRLSGARLLPSGSWQAKCPAHDDHEPSLSISHGFDGRALLKCHAGCETGDVLQALGLTEVDLFPVRDAGKATPASCKSEIAVCYDYEDASGSLVYQVVRFEPKAFRQRRPDGNGGWIWNTQGVTSIPYNLPKLLAADPADFIFIPEGEKDVDALTTIGLTATTNSGGANAWRMISDLSAFRNRRVIIVPDRDEPGQRHADEIARSLQGIAKETRLLDLGKIGGFLGNDVSDWLYCLDAKEPDELAEALLEMATASPLWDGAGCPSSAGLFDREDSLLPSFPTEALPSWLGEMVRGTAISKQTPVDLAGTIGLGVLSLACAGRFWVKIKHGWQEPLNLYCSTVLPVACRKTPTYDAMLSPVTEFQKTLKARMSTVIARAKTEKDMLEGKLARLKKLATEKGDDSAKAQALDLSVELGSITIPAEPCLYTSNTTAEGVVRMLDEQSGHAAVFSEEGGELVDIIAGRYSKNGHSNMEIFLKAHAGTPINETRADRRRPQLSIENPALTMVLCLQPTVMESAWQRQDFNERGLIARFLWSLPPSPLGRRTARPPDLSLQASDDYVRNVTSLLNTCYETRRMGKPSILIMSSEAREKLLDFVDEIEPGLGPDGQHEHMSGWVGKLAGTIARIAGLLHVAGNHEILDSPEKTPISVQTLLAAIRIGLYYLAHAEHAYTIYGSTAEERMSARILGWAKRVKKDSFTERELMRALVVKKEQIEEPIRNLQDGGYIREIHESDFSQSCRTGRPRSKKWCVIPHPKTSSVNSVNGVSI